MWKFHSRRKAKISESAGETSKSASSLPTEASSSTFEALSSEVGYSQLALPSTFSRLSTHSQPRPADRSLDPLGLNILHDPGTDPSADIIFVHGLGGTSRATWCFDRDPEFFWPQKWLPSEPAIKTARILSFGYNSQFTAPGPAPITGISDFAKDLLFAMKFAKNEHLEELGIGERPIVFIVHSMGGLVVKKAYILGQNSEDYKEIVSSVKAILFLATPHRGTHLAGLLNRILSVSIFNHSPKQYVAELSNGSQALEDLNEQFRFIAPKLQILSFYETLPTRIGLRKIMVLEKNSSILGYPTETSKPLNADHNHVCKYETSADPNYVSIRNALKTLVDKLQVAKQELLRTQGQEQLMQLESLLGIPDNHSEDLAFFQKRWTPGTCAWILSSSEYMSWCEDSTEFKVLWLYSLPATGKSILSSFVVSNLHETKAICAYYFFRFSDRTKRSLSACLRSLAIQIAHQVPPFRKALHDLSLTGVKLEKADAKTIWTKIFTSILFKLNFERSIYWIIDGLDESDSPRLLVEFIQTMSTSVLPIKVFLAGRRSPELVSAFQRLSSTVLIQNLTMEDSANDIRLYVEQEIYFMHAQPNLKTQVVKELLQRANGNFLWVNLALTEIHLCLTAADIEETLKGLPSGMSELYHRMELSILKSTRPRDQTLTRIILTWATCSPRPLLLSELEEALKPEFSVLLDLRHTISQVCGQFVVIDSSERLVMVHQTAKEYLLRSKESGLYIIPSDAHQTMFAKCMHFLDSGTLHRGFERRKPSQAPAIHEPFLLYAATTWPYHLDLTSPNSNESLVIVVKFLSSISVLSWISSVAELGQLKVLAHASRTLNNFVRRKRNSDSEKNPPLPIVKELELIELWATDIIKILGKFGPNLTKDPSTIFKQIPSFCPQETMIYKQFGKERTGISITGLSPSSWDDSLAKIAISSGPLGITVVSSGNNFAVLTTSGEIGLYSTTTFEPVHHLGHGERVTAISFSYGCDRIVSSGFHTTKVWSVATGKVIFKIQNPPRTRALKIIFSPNNNSLLVASDDRGIRVASLKAPEPTWSLIDERLLREDSPLHRTVINSPCSIAFSPDATHVAVAYRGFPLSVWGIDPPELIGRCRRNPHDPNGFWAPVDHITWHPYSGEVVGIYIGGHVFKWHPYTGAYQETRASASIIASSPDGKFFATTDGRGTIKLYDHDHFVLVYQLSCEGVLNDISFSPDSRRLYDLRDQYCNIWEPNTLLRLNDADEHERDSEVGSELGNLPTAAIPEAVMKIRDPITAISVQPKGSHRAVGSESGIVSIFDSSNTAPLVELFQAWSMMAIEHLDWAENGQRLACSDLGGKTTVISLTPPGSDGFWTWSSIFETHTDVPLGGIQQIMLNIDGTILLLASRHTATLLSVDKRFDTMSKTIPLQNSAARWIKHPSDPRLLLVFTVNFIRVFQWDNLVEVAVLEISSPKIIPQKGNRPQLKQAGRSAGEMGFEITRLVVTTADSHILFQYSMATKWGERYLQTLLFDVPLSSEVTDTFKIETKLIQPQPLALPEDTNRKVNIPLGILSKNRFIYVDNDFSICSMRMNGLLMDETSVRSHFFLPMDWLNADCLQLCTLLHDGTFLIPHNGEIAVIKSSVMSEW